MGDDLLQSKERLNCPRANPKELPSHQHVMKRLQQLGRLNFPLKNLLLLLSRSPVNLKKKEKIRLLNHPLKRAFRKKINEVF